MRGCCQARQENAHPPKYPAECEVPVSEVVVAVNHHVRMLASNILRPLHQFHCSLPRSRDGVGMTMRQWFRKGARAQTIVRPCSLYLPVAFSAVNPK